MLYFVILYLEKSNGIQKTEFLHRLLKMRINIQLYWFMQFAMTKIKSCNIFM